MKFEKPPLSLRDQIERLRQRGMQVADAGKAEHYLRHISYYRLRAYWFPFEDGALTGSADHHFRPDARFEDVVSLYVFDRELRLHVLDAIERIEVSVRASWAHHIAMTYGSHGHLDSSLYKNANEFRDKMIALDGEVARSTETFIKHYKTQYDDPERPPVWMAAELLSIGKLSWFFSNLKAARDRQAIAKPFGVDEKILGSFLHHLTLIRNICAHHGRLWNKRFTIAMMLPRYPSSVALAMNKSAARSLYNTLVMMAYLIRVVSPKSSWLSQLRELILDNPLAPPEAMGFPPQWQDMSFWRMQP